MWPLWQKQRYQAVQPPGELGLYAVWVCVGWGSAWRRWTPLEMKLHSRTVTQKRWSSSVPETMTDQVHQSVGIHFSACFPSRLFNNYVGNSLFWAGPDFHVMFSHTHIVEQVNGSLSFTLHLSFSVLSAFGWLKAHMALTVLIIRYWSRYW